MTGVGAGENQGFLAENPRGITIAKGQVEYG
jgi:hypothetical protein